MKKKIKFLIKYILTFLILAIICIAVSFGSYLLEKYLPIFSYIIAIAIIGFFAYEIAR